MMPNEEIVQLVMNQMEELQAKHPDLELIVSASGDLIVTGVVRFCIEHEGRTVRDAYQIALVVPSDYPSTPPVVWETGNAIPQDFHKFKPGNLCLGAPVEVRRVFAQHKSLLGFIDRQVIPHLFSHSYRRDYGELPHGELPHGFLGLLEYYADFFGIGRLTAMKLLKLLADGFVPPLMKCPCGRGKKLRDCHGPKLEELRPHYPPQSFEAELRGMISALEAQGIRLPERILPRRLLKNREKRRRRKAKRG